MIQRFAFDLRHAVRSLRLRPGFSLLVIATLALGIGASAAIFQYLGYFVWPTVQAPEPERVVWVHRATADDPMGAFSHQEWRQLEAELLETDLGDAFETLSARRVFGASLRGSERTIHGWGRAVSGDYFATFARPPHFGRLLTADDDRPGAERVLVLSYETWTRHFASDPDVIGTSLVLDGGHAYTVVGVTRKGFQGTGLWVSLYTPLATTRQLLLGADDPNYRRLVGMARLAPDVEVEALEARLQTLANDFERSAGVEPRGDGDEKGGEPALRIDLQPSTTITALPDDPYVDGARLMMWVVLALLALACANVANLFLARGADRTKEMAVLAALGANRRRLALRLLLESTLLSLVGAGLGLALSTKLTELLEGYLQASLPIGFGEWASGSTLFTQNWRITLFVAGLTAGAAVLFSLAPMAQASRLDLVSALKSETRGGTSGVGRRLSLRKVLAVTQVAMSAALLLTAGLLVRTLGAVNDVDLGFQPDGVSVAALHVPRGDLEVPGDAGSPADVIETALQRTREMPGVESAGVVNRLPLSFAFPSLEVRADVEGSDSEAESPNESQIVTAKAAENIASEGYFETFGIPVQEGRPFAATDTSDAHPVVIVNRELAEQLWPGESAAGRRLVWGEGENAEAVTVVGVVANHRLATPTEAIVPMLYRPFRQDDSRRVTLVARSSAPILQPMHRMLRSEFPDVSLIELAPFDRQRDVATAAQRMNAELSAGFGLLGLFLAGLGIFSVLAYGVARRSREIGIRMAIGARHTDVRTMILGESGRLLAAGLAVGCVVAFALGRVLEHLLYGVSAFDPLTYAVVAATLAAMGQVAAWWPARRASAIEPMDALRSE